MMSHLILCDDVNSVVVGTPLLVQKLVVDGGTQSEGPAQVLLNDFAWLCSSLMSSTTTMRWYPQS